MPNYHKLRTALIAAINECSAENGSNTPDYVLGDYLMDCLHAFDKATALRDQHANLDKVEPDTEPKAYSPDEEYSPEYIAVFQRHVDDAHPREQIEVIEYPSRLAGYIDTGKMGSDRSEYVVNNSPIGTEDGVSHSDTMAQIQALIDGKIRDEQIKVIDEQIEVIDEQIEEIDDHSRDVIWVAPELDETCTGVMQIVKNFERELRGAYSQIIIANDRETPSGPIGELFNTLFSASSPTDTPTEDVAPLTFAQKVQNSHYLTRVLTDINTVRQMGGNEIVVAIEPYYPSHDVFANQLRDEGYGCTTHGSSMTIVWDD